MGVEDVVRGFLGDVAAATRPSSMDSFRELRTAAARWLDAMDDPAPPPPPEPPEPPPPEPPATTGNGWDLDEASTGVPAGVTLTPRSAVTVTTPGTVLEGLDISGGLVVKAADVTVRHCRVRGSGWQVVDARGVSGLRLERCTIDGQGVGEGSHGVNGSGTLVGCRIVGVENGVNCYDNLRMEGCWVTALKAPGSPHYDGVQNDGASRMTLVGCRIECHGPDGRPLSQTSAVMVDNYFAAVTDVLIERCLLSGGGYTLYLDGSFSSSRTISNVRVLGNRIRKGYWGHSLRRGALSDVTWAGNVDADTLAPVN